MQNIKQINNTINSILQKSNKQYKTCNINIKKKQEILFLNYLHYNKIIYGYTLKYNTKYLIYLKYRQTNNGLKFKKLNENQNYKTLYKQKLWLKNNFFIINTIKGFQNINKTVSLKIGGFLLYAIC